MLKFDECEDSRLNKQATALKKSGDMLAAVAVLKQIKTNSGDQYADTRLAKYLQQAGLFDEAVAEIKWLLDHSQAWAQAMFGHQPVSVVQCQRAGWCARVHADAVLICKRAKQPDLQAQHQTLHERYLSIAQRLRPVSDADVKARALAWEVARAHGPQAMQAYNESTRRRQ